MTLQYRIEEQYFDEKYEMGVLIQLKEIDTGAVIYKSPLELFNDVTFLEKLSVEDVRLVGYIVGDYQMYRSQKVMHANSGWIKNEKPGSLM